MATFYLSFFFLEGPNSEGKISSTPSVAGQLLFFGIVTVVNLRMIWWSNNFTFFTYFLTIGSIVTYVVYFWIVNILGGYSFSVDVYKEF